MREQKFTNTIDLGERWIALPRRRRKNMKEWLSEFAMVLVIIGLVYLFLRVGAW
jgi:hypothetical protein